MLFTIAWADFFLFRHLSFLHRYRRSGLNYPPSFFLARSTISSRQIDKSISDFRFLYELFLPAELTRRFLQILPAKYWQVDFYLQSLPAKTCNAQQPTPAPHTTSCYLLFTVYPMAGRRPQQLSTVSSDCIVGVDSTTSRSGVIHSH